MPDINLAIMELSIARDQIDVLLKKDFSPWLAGSIHWNTLVIHIENCWTKAERGCKDVQNKFQPWQGKYEHKRKKDELLKYVKNARHAATHSHQEIALAEKVRDLPIENMPEFEITDSKGNPVSKEGAQYFQSNLRLQKFTNEDKSYFPPETHLGKNVIDPKDPIVVGSLAIAFYWDFLNETNKMFCQNRYDIPLKMIFDKILIGNLGYINGKEVTIPFAIDKNFNP